MDTFHTETESRIPTRLQIQSDNARARNWAWNVALGLRSAAMSNLDDAVRLLTNLRDSDADKSFLYDTARGLRDQFCNIEAAIHRDLDRHDLIHCEPIDLSELDAFIREVA